MSALTHSETAEAHSKTAEAHSETTEETFVSAATVEYYQSIQNKITAIAAFLVFLMSSIAIVYILLP